MVMVFPSPQSSPGGRGSGFENGFVSQNLIRIKETNDAILGHLKIKAHPASTYIFLRG